VLAVREYQEKPIPGEVLRRIVDAAHLTASSVNMQPWHFVLVTDRDELRALGRLIHTGRYVASAAAAVVVAYEKESEYGVSDASRAIQSMILTAWGDGVGSNWTGWAGMEDVRKRVGLPEIYDVIAVVPFGYPKRAVGKGKKKRKPIAEVVSVGRYGTPID
jgi:nitroreductase